MLIRQFVIDGLGHLSALVVDESAGVAAVVDPRRDVDVYLDAAAEADLRIERVVETHLHNDYVSGGRELAARTGAEHVIGSGAELRYAHRPVGHADTFEVGALRFTALRTPGHTPEHVAYAVADTSRADEPVALFTGGSLLVGAVGRTDLLGAEHADPYARDMFRSIHEVVLRHEDFVAVYPTHGAGSLCSTGISATPASTIGFERRYNPMVQPVEVDAFIRRLLGSQPTFPAYFARMRPINRDGPSILGSVPGPRPLPVLRVRELLRAGALLVDLRPPAVHAAGHVPGSISIPAGSSFGTWLGWVVPADRPLVLMLADPAEWDDAVRQALRIGYENLEGHVRGGFGAWVNAGGEVETGGRLSVGELADALRRDPRMLVIDVRQASEFEEGHVPGAVHLDTGSLPARLAELPRDRPIAAICASGYRSSVAASILRQSGFTDVAWVADGLPAWSASGLPVERGVAEEPVPATGRGHGPHSAP